jgi:uncharacterized integral membrane protein
MKTKIILFMIIIVLFTFFITQNNQIVTINFFFWQYNVTAIILIVMTGFIGVVLGLILDSIIRSRKKDKSNKKINLVDDVKKIV